MSPLLALALLAPPKDLAEYLKVHPWNVVENGPMLVLEPERARATPPVAGIGSFGRRKVPVGGITALVPPTRIDIDDSLAGKPDLYEGLPRDAKVLYLLRSLDDAQWRTAGTRGIGLRDLRGEQALVFESLLPKRFAWRANRLDKTGYWGQDAGKGTLSAQERAGVRLRIERTVEMQVFLRDPPNASSSFGTDRYHGAPGTVSLHRDQDDEFVQTGAFGLDIRKTVPNVPKPSQLDTKGSPFDTTVAVPVRTTVGEILRGLGPKVGTEIVPDFRVADRTVGFYGGRASARDLLAALALSVEGTYRRVGTAYVLTSDLAGMGARKLRLAQWQENLRRDTDRRTSAWRHEIGATDGYATIGFGADGPEVDGKAAEAITQGDLRYGSSTVDPATLGPDLRRFLDQWDKEYTQQPIRKDKVGLSSELAYRYVLPDGRPLDVEGGLGPSFIFREPKNAVPPAPSGGFKPPFAVGPSVRLSFHVAAEDAATADAAVRSVGRFAGSEVWIETHSKTALLAALAAARPLGVTLGLAIRPWRANVSDPDRNLAGDYGPTLRQKMGEPAPDRPMRGGDLRPHIGIWMAPADPAVGPMWRAYAELAATPGLAGVMLLETQPFGYERERLEWQSTSQPLDWATVSHGYTVAERLAFLRQEGIDPIDIGDGGYWTTPDLRQTYFFDDGLRGMPTVYDGSDDTNPKTRTVAALWRKRLEEVNAAAVGRLASALGSGPVWIEERLANINSLGQDQAAIAPWKLGEALPVSQERGALPKAARYYPVALSANPMDPDFMLLRSILSREDSPTAPMPRIIRPLFELADVPAARLDAVLRQWLRAP